jgi:hypothetical protein
MVTLAELRLQNLAVQWQQQCVLSVPFGTNCQEGIPSITKSDTADQTPHLEPNGRPAYDDLFDDPEYFEDDDEKSTVDGWHLRITGISQWRISRLIFGHFSGIQSHYFMCCILNSALTSRIHQMMYVSGETAEPSPETTGMVEEIVRQQVIEMVCTQNNPFGFGN